jgi:uncharacterized membrane protein YhaH (DUF805 family)
MGREPLIRTLFSFSGRMKRSDYLLASLGLAVGRVVTLILALAVTHGRMDDEIGFIVRPVLDLAFFWPSAAIAIKRGHDRDRRTGYTAIMIAVFYGLGVAVGYLMDADQRDLGTVCALLVLGGWIYMLIDLGLIDGTRGPNQYGPSPKGDRGAGGVGDDLAKVFD